jgi:hypothetical protein
MNDEDNDGSTNVSEESIREIRIVKSKKGHVTKMSTDGTKTNTVRSFGILKRAV